MCGRYTLRKPAGEVAEAFDVPEVFEFPPRFNIAPTQDVPVVRLGPGAGGPGTGPAALGPDPLVGRRPGHRQPDDQRPGRDGRREARLPARLQGEAVPGRGRCVLRVGEARRPQAAVSHPPEGRPALRLRRPVGVVEQGRRADRVLHHHHDRGQRVDGPDPRPDAGDRARGRPTTSGSTRPSRTPEKLQPLLVPFPAEEMEAYPVSTLVNNPKNDVEGCIRRVG